MLILSVCTTRNEQRRRKSPLGQFVEADYLPSNADLASFHVEHVGRSSVSSGKVVIVKGSHDLEKRVTGGRANRKICYSKTRVHREIQLRSGTTYSSLCCLWTIALCEFVAKGNPSLLCYGAYSTKAHIFYIFQLV